LTLKTWIFPADAKTLVHRGESYQRRANLNGALADYDQALLVEPNCADARDKKVNVLLSLSLFDRAWAANQQLDHDSVAYLANKARIQQARGDYLAAAKSFEELRLSDPLSRLDGNRQILAEELYQAAGDFEDATRCASALVRLEPDSGANEAWSAELAICLIGEGKYSEALHITNQIIRPRKDMYSPEHRLIRGRAYFGLGQYQAAIKDATNYLGLYPRDEQAYKLRSACYRRIGETGKADQDRLLYVQYQKDNADVDF
jgi:tetratricopeptide (TPR) repeat protein